MKYEVTKRRILCVGDSLGLPRKEIPYEDTWFCLLTKKLPVFEYIPRFQRAMTTDFLVKGNSEDFLENFKPDIIVIQLGIVDCAPRYLPENTIWVKILNRLPSGLNRLFWKFWKKNKKRNTKYSYVLPGNFKKNLIEYLKRCVKSGVERVIIIKISNPGARMLNKNPGITEQICLYNNIYDSLAKEHNIVELIDPLKSGLNDYYIEDGYHLNKNGAEIISDKLIEKLSQL